MIVKVVLFAVAREIAGQPQIELSLDDAATLEDAKNKLVDQFPDLEVIAQRSAFSVDQEYVNDNRQLHHGAEIGFIPPVSGG